MCSKMFGAIRALLATASAAVLFSGSAQARESIPHALRHLESDAQFDGKSSSHTRALTQSKAEQEQRIGLANHAAGLNLVFYEVLI